MNSKVYILAYTSPLLVPSLSQMNPIHALSFYLFKVRFNIPGILWRSWLGHCATSRKVAGSISYSF